MKLTLLSLMVSLTFVSLSAQDTHMAHSSLEAAQQEAREKQAPILMVFAGSDWCHPCIQFKKEILESEAFKAYQADNLVLLYLDFPSKRKNQLAPELKKQNEQLAERFNKDGSFPKILLVDTDLNKLADLKFTNQLPSDFIADCKQKLSE